MRTTLDISIDVLQAAKERARINKKTIGEVISELARQALNAMPAPHTTGTTRNAQSALTAQEPKAVYGVRPFPKRGGIVTNEFINTLRDEID